MDFLGIVSKSRSGSPNAKYQARVSRFSVDDSSKLDRRRSSTPTVADVYKKFSKSAASEEIAGVGLSKKNLEVIPEISVESVRISPQPAALSEINTDVVFQQERQSSGELSARKRSGSLVESLRGKVEASSPKDESNSPGSSAIKADIVFRQERQNSGEFHVRKRSDSLVDSLRGKVEAGRDSTV